MTSKNDLTMDAIPLADDETTAEITEADILKLSLGSGNKTKAAAAVTAVRSSGSPNQAMSSTESIPYGGAVSTSSSSPAQPNSLDIDINPDEAEEKDRLISQVLELQNTLDELSLRVDSVKEENLKLKSENQVLGQYIENLMSASSVFQSTSPKVTSKTASPQPDSNSSKTPDSKAASSNAAVTSTNSVII